MYFLKMGVRGDPNAEVRGLVYPYCNESAHKLKCRLQFRGLGFGVTPSTPKPLNSSKTPRV